jgi:hypothetical protein
MKVVFLLVCLCLDNYHCVVAYVSMATVHYYTTKFRTAVDISWTYNVLTSVSWIKVFCIVHIYGTLIMNKLGMKKCGQGARRKRESQIQSE